MGPHRKMGIYVGYYSTYIIKYLELMTGDLFTGCTMTVSLMRIIFSIRRRISE
jgi:hypothetical protein